MKTRHVWMRLGLVAGLGLSLGLTSLSAREYYEDLEAWGKIRRVDDYKKVIHVDRGPDRKPLAVKWNRDTQFRNTERRIPISSLRDGQRVRVYYRMDARRTGMKEPLANKVIVNPLSTPQDRRYNQ